MAGARHVSLKKMLEFCRLLVESWALVLTCGALAGVSADESSGGHLLPVGGCAFRSAIPP
jgi:hypothetical protein